MEIFSWTNSQFFLCEIIFFLRRKKNCLKICKYNLVNNIWNHPHIQQFRTICKTPLGTNPKSPKLFESSFKTCLGYPVNNTKASSLFELEMLGLLSPRFCLIY